MRPHRGPQKSHFGQQKASASVLRIICCNHVLMGDFMEAFYRPPCIPSQTRYFVGATTSFRGQNPSRPHIIRPLRVTIQCIHTWNVAWRGRALSYTRRCRRTCRSTPAALLPFTSHHHMALILLLHILSVLYSSGFLSTLLTDEYVIL